MKKTICLNMIVRNEGKIIERCLLSLVEHIDYWVICDTGSNDYTKEIIKDFFYKYNVPGELHEKEWVNFEHNRNEALQLVKGKSDYILLIDSDMILKVHDEDWKNKIPYDTNLVKQENNIEYYNTRLIKGNLNYRYFGVTHEYLSCLDSNTTGKFDLITMDDLADGGYKSEKFTRDIKLLRDGLEKEPDNVRYIFYLANSYKDSDQKEQAIKWYKKRVKKGGWIEEVYMSLLNIGRCYQSLNDWSKAQEYYIKAFEYHPKRIESIYEIVKYYRENNQPVLGYSYAKMVIDIPYPKDDVLFIEKNVYEYLLKYELSICVCYVGEKEKGRKLCDELIFSHSTPEYIRNSCLSNLFFYLEKLQGTSVQELSDSKTHPNYNFCNPSILYNEKFQIINLREVSYQFDIEKNVYSYDNTIDTYNHLISIYDHGPSNPDQSGLAGKIILPSITSTELKTYNNYITGIEDLRLFDKNGELWAIGTCRTTNPTGLNEMVAIKININKNLLLSESLPHGEVGGAVVTAIRLKGFGNTECQKNWVPINYKGETYFLYSSYPFILLKPDWESGICEKFLEKTPDKNFSNFRGSSQVIEFDGGYLYIVHEVIHKDNRRYYYHRFVYLNSELDITKVSEPFYFIDKTIEYCAGVTQVENELWITMGYEDKKAYLIKIDANKVKNLLHIL